MNKNILILIIIILAGGVGYLGWAKYYGAGNTTTGNQVACTMEAKLCPDGSSVGRSGPTCEFAACPVETSIPGTESWKTSTAEGMSFRYPEQLGTTYIQTAEWPPKLEITKSSKWPCENNVLESDNKGGFTFRLVNNWGFCIKITSEGAAGSTYNSYTYVTDKDNTVDQDDTLMTLMFALRFPQCSNYDEPKKTECESERTSFDIDDIVDRIARTVEFH